MIDPKILEYATPEELAELEELLPLLGALDTPLEFAQLISPETETYPHVEMISEHLKALVEYRLYPSGPGPVANWWYEDRKTREWLPASSREEIPKDARAVEGRHPTDETQTVSLRLGIVMPPRHGKSWITTQHFPIWVAGRVPGIKLCVYTYSNEKGYEWGEDVRDRIVGAESKLGFSVTRGKDSNRSHLKLTNGSTMRFGGVGGLLTGSGWNGGIIDDPFKGNEDAYSGAERKNKADWYSGVWSNRRENIWAWEVMMFTRWHEDDLAGRYIYDDAGKPVSEWCLLHLPALCVDPDTDPLHREEDEALCPERFNEAYLMEQRSEHPDKFQSLYQGWPTMEEGGILKRPYNYYHHVTKNHRNDLMLLHPDGNHEYINARELYFFGVCDIAATTKSRSDWTVFTYWGFDTLRRLFLFDLHRFRAESPDIPAMLLDWFGRKKTGSLLEVCIEKSGAGLPVVQMLQRQGKIPIRALEPKDYGGDKVSRAFPAGQAILSRELWMPGKSAFQVKLEIEMKQFPNGTYDDQVDCIGYANQLRFEYPTWSVERATDLTIEEQIELSIREKERERNPGGRVETMLSPGRPL